MKKSAWKPLKPSQIDQYDISSTMAVGGGKRWTDSFSKASKRALGWLNGAHGVRHSYAQARMDNLQQHYRYETALRVVSQEMGHFRPKITEVYLR